VLKEFYRVAFRNQNLPLAPKLQSVRQSQGQPICGHDRGAVNWNCLASLVETAKLHGLDPQSYLADIIGKLVNGRLQNRRLVAWRTKRRRLAA
jgi:hypothetical protein